MYKVIVCDIYFENKGIHKDKNILSIFFVDIFNTQVNDN